MEGGGKRLFSAVRFLGMQAPHSPKKFHTQMQQSLPTETTCLPSGLNTACRAAPSCLEYVPVAAPGGALDTRALACSRCRCQPQQHQAVDVGPAGYDPHSPEQVEARRPYDERLQSPEERAATRKARAAQAQAAGQLPAAPEQPPSNKADTAPAPASLTRPVQPKFHFLEINTSNLSGLVAHINVDTRLPLLKAVPTIVAFSKAWALWSFRSSV